MTALRRNIKVHLALELSRAQADAVLAKFVAMRALMDVNTERLVPEDKK